MTMQVPHCNHSYSNMSFITYDSQNNEVERPGEWITVFGLKYAFCWVYNVYSVISIPWASVSSSTKWGLEAEKSLPALTFHELWFCLSSATIAFHLLLSPRPISATRHPTLYAWKLTSWIEFPGFPCLLSSGWSQPTEGLGRKSESERTERGRQWLHGSAHRVCWQTPSTEQAFTGIW